MSPQGSFPHSRSIEILLVEDDDDDVRLVKTALEAGEFPSRIHRVEDGVQAIEFLSHEGEYKDAVRPDIVLLDLNMPRKSGREVLREIKSQSEIRCIPVVVLTTSDDEHDVLSSYENYASSYLTKPIDLHEFRRMLETLANYWFKTVRLPPVV